MTYLVRFIVPLAFVAVFLALATVALDKPGYYYDEVIFVPAALRVLGQCDVDAAVTMQIGCFPLMQTLGYVGAVKAWLHAPLFGIFGINVWTVRLPSILLAAATILSCCGSSCGASSAAHGRCCCSRCCAPIPSSSTTRASTGDRR